MKLNNKGFAISTIVYGISIMGLLLVSIIMATMSTNRSNTKEMVKDLETYLNRKGETTTRFNAEYIIEGDGTITPIERKYTVPEGESGWYRIDLLGSMKMNDGNTIRGCGAFTSGIIYLNEGENLYFYVGADGNETDVRIVGGGYADEASFKTRIMVAGGGGTSPDLAHNAPGGTLYGYNNKLLSRDGYLNNNSNNLDTFLELSSSSPYYSNNGTLIWQPEDYKYITPNSIFDGFDGSSIRGQDGGGDGYIPGSGNQGGSSFISGYAGEVAITTDANNTAVSSVGTPPQAVYTNGTRQYSFINGKMYPNASCLIEFNAPPVPDRGNGLATITKVSSKADLTMRNDKLKKIKKVKDCLFPIKAGDQVEHDDFVQASITYLESNSVKSKTVNGGIITGSETEKIGGKTLTGKCSTYDFTPGTSQNIDIRELGIWHKNEHKYYNVIKVYDSASNETYLKKANSTINAESETSTIKGIHISAYEQDFTKELKPGNYYIQSVLSENQVLTANTNNFHSADAITLENINALPSQIWTIAKLDDGNYKIVENRTYKALKLADERAYLGTEVNAESEYYGDVSQKWKITPVGDGTYIITTNAPLTNSGIGNLIAATHYPSHSYYSNSKLIVGNNRLSTMRFKFIPADYN